MLAINGESTTREPCARRRERLEALALDGHAWKTAPTFDDGEALYAEVVRRRLEGVVAKRLRDPYRPGERSWIKRKNPNGPRFEQEREAAMRRPARMY